MRYVYFQRTKRRGNLVYAFEEINLKSGETKGNQGKTGESQGKSRTIKGN